MSTVALLGTGLLGSGMVEAILRLGDAVTVWNRTVDALQKMATEVWYLGERADLAAAYKLIGNAMAYAITGALADVLALARELGVATGDAAQVISKFRIGGAIPGLAQKG